MSRIKRARPSPALVISIVAMFAALGGGAFAATATTSKKALDSKGNLQKNVVKKKNIAKNAVVTKKIKDGKVTGSKLSEGSVSASKLGSFTVRTTTGDVPGDPAPGNGLSEARTSEVSCNAGEKAIGGGISDIQPENNGAQRGLALWSRYILDGDGTPTGIRARVGNDAANPVTSYTIEVLCLG